MKRITGIYDRTIEIIGDLKVAAGSSLFASVIGKLTNIVY